MELGVGGEKGAKANVVDFYVAETGLGTEMVEGFGGVAIVVDWVGMIGVEVGDPGMECAVFFEMKIRLFDGNVWVEKVFEEIEADDGVECLFEFKWFLKIKLDGVFIFGVEVGEGEVGFGGVEMAKV